MKKHGKIILLALLVYAVLLALLVAAEAASPDASIRTLWDAVWFSLITMTTVGYGDLSPVTPAGRVLGLIFALCSIGILSALIGLGLHLIGGQLMPRLRLRLGRRRTWYVFHEENEDAAALASELRRGEKGCLIVFPAGGEKLLSGPELVRLSAESADLVRLRGGTEGLSMFFMGPNGWENFGAGLEAAALDLPAYCMADIASDAVPPQLHLFARSECLSRCYWKEHPLRREEKRVVLIGCGGTGSALLERALLTNVFEPGRCVEYHVFGDSADFAALHPGIVRALVPGTPGEDSLFLHGEPWSACPSVLRGADRIILCCDEDRENLELYEKLHTWFAPGAPIHIRLNAPLPQLDSFGGREEIITREFVMKDAVNRCAVMLNDIYNENAAHPAAWNELSYFLRQSNIAAADHLIVKIRFLLDDDGITELTGDNCRRAWEVYRRVGGEQAELLQEMEHRRWLRFHLLHNWEYAPVRDNALRRHNLMVPYGELNEEERRKDAYAWQLLGKLAEAYGAPPSPQTEQNT